MLDFGAFRKPAVTSFAKWSPHKKHIHQDPKAGFLFRILLPLLKNSMVIYFLDADRIMDLLDILIGFREQEVLSYYEFKWKKS